MLKFEFLCSLMKKIIVFLLMLSACKNYRDLKVLANLPADLEEASGVELINGSDLLWMHNDSGNEPFIYGVDMHGNICLLYTSPSPRDATLSRMPSSA